MIPLKMLSKLHIIEYINNLLLLIIGGSGTSTFFKFPALILVWLTPGVA